MKLIIAYILEKDYDVFKLSYESIKDFADKIIVVWSPDLESGEFTKKDFFETYGIEKTDKIQVINSMYEHGYLGANGKQRNVYLEFIKREYEGEWCLVLDADEVVDDGLERTKKSIVEINEKFKERYLLLSIRMRHFIQDLAHEDNTVEVHYVPNRLFKIRKELYYDEVEHPILSVRNENPSDKIMFFNIDLMVIWHLGYAREIFNFRKKYLNHLRKSNIHTERFLLWWYHSHITGSYPRKEISVINLPERIKNYFLIHKDYCYFYNRASIESKHVIECRQWRDFFNPVKILDCGCGLGHRTYLFDCMGIETYGFDTSAYAVENTYLEIRNKVWYQSLTEKIKLKEFDLVIAYDVLEHLEESELSGALENIYEAGNKNFLFSIPFLGDRNLELDRTHKIKRDKTWWLDMIRSVGFKIQEVPQHFLFREQLIWFTK